MEQGLFLLRAEQPGGWACSAESASVCFNQAHFSSVSFCFTMWNLRVWESSATSAISSDPSLAAF